MSAPSDAPQSSSAEVHILFTGYVGQGVAGTVAYVRDGEARVIIDPGIVPSRSSILEPLAALGVSVESITDVIFSHHHPDHTLHAALFPNARFHDHWAIYRGDHWHDRPAEGFQVSPSIRLIETPGHTPQDITTLVRTKDGILAFTHLCWHAKAPAEYTLADDMAAIHANRERVIKIATQIVPGHGAPFTPGPETPR
jgi:glyoxylase-like metal-dependent hydrolase (beta-lactamase superfamily II)